MPGDNQNKSGFPQSDLSQSLPSVPNDQTAGTPINAVAAQTDPSINPAGSMPQTSSPSPLDQQPQTDVPPQESSILNPTPPTSGSSTPPTFTDTSGQEPSSVPPAGNIGSDDPSVVTSSHVPKKYGGQKVIATIFSILFIVGAVVAGVVLVQRQQLLEQEAASGSECQRAADCILLDNPGNSGSFNAPQTIKKVDITDQDVHTYNPGSNDDGCRRVNISGNSLTWERYGSGNTCKDVSNVQVWLGEEPTPTTPPANTPTTAVTSGPTPTTPPGVTITATPIPSLTPTLPPQISAKCNEVNAYDANGNPLSQSQLVQLSPGDSVLFAVSGQTSSGSFSKARFTVNGTQIGESTTQNTSGEYYFEYTIPDNVATFSVKGEVFHSSLGWI
jgi:hypothetical protein